MEEFLPNGTEGIGQELAGRNEDDAADAEEGELPEERTSLDCTSE